MTHLTCFSTHRTCVPECIQHEYSAVMKEKCSGMRYNMHVRMGRVARR